MVGNAQTNSCVDITGGLNPTGTPSNGTDLLNVSVRALFGLVGHDQGQMVELDCSLVQINHSAEGHF